MFVSTLRNCPEHAVGFSFVITRGVHPYKAIPQAAVQFFYPDLVMPRQRVTSKQPNSVVLLFPPDDLYSTFKHFISETVLFQMEIRKISRRRPRSVDDAELDRFTLLFCRGR